MQNNKRSIVTSAFIAIFSSIIPATFWLIPDPALQSMKEKIAEEDLISPSNSVKPQAIEMDISKRISIGEQILIAADRNPSKLAAVEAFNIGDYRNAVTIYDAALKIQRNDPEAWIYQNNAYAIASNNFLKIAVSVSIGGNLNIAKEILRGVAQAQQEVNSRGGIKGKLLLVAIANDNNEPSTVRAIAHSLSRDERILGVIGHNSTEASVAAAPIYQQSGLVMISATSVGSGLSDLGSYIFRTTPDTRATADVLAHYTVKSARQTNVAVCFTSDERASRSFKDGFEWSIFQAGGKLIETDCDFSQPDFNPVDVPAQAISSGADALLLSPSIDDLDEAIAVIQANENRLPLLANQSMYTFETLKQGWSDANNMVLSVAWHSQTERARIFTQETQSLWGGSVNWRTAMAYDATKAIAVGLELESTSRWQLQATLSNPDFAFAGATGKVQFLPSGDRNLKGILVKVESGDRSGVGYDFVTVKPLNYFN